MAKGLRASSRKKNNQALRAKVFAPVIDARTERLSAKLQELAAKPRPEQAAAAADTKDVEMDKAEQTEPADVASDEMDLDSQAAKIKRVKRQNIRTGGRGETEKKIAKRKAKNSLIFAQLRARRTRVTKSKRK